MQTAEGSQANDAGKPPLRLSASTLRAWTVWVAVTSLVYSLVDWRMTKHLAPLFVPLFLIPAAWSARGPVARILVIVTFCGLFFWNVNALRLVMEDFQVLTITPAW
jgi:hypothetical protein